MESPRNFKISNVTINYPRLDTPVNPFGTEQYEMQIATTDKAKADELKANFLNVKEKDGVFTVSLKRKATKADGSDNGKVRVVDNNLAPIENTRNIGNGSVANVIVFQYPYEAMGRSGIASSLTAVQITSMEVYESTSSVDFDIVASEAPVAEVKEGGVDLF